MMKPSSTLSRHGSKSQGVFKDSDECKMMSYDEKSKSSKL